VAGVIGQAAAQDAAVAAEPMRRVEITGSAIKRIESETALPVQVITREEIDKVGVTTASEILARLSAPTSAA
jgi:iron complex outermembrane receptor protein